MLHIDICRDLVDLQTNVEHPRLRVQTSVDGAGWTTQYVIYPDASEVERDLDRRELDETLRAHAQQDNEAVRWARALATGARLSGADARITMFGYTI